jgi:hypothetical protein
VANSRSTKFSMRDAARASGFALNTLRSLYGRGHFQILGGEDKKGRGLAADLSVEDIMCIAVAKVAIDAGVHPRTAFKAGRQFAYSSGGACDPHTGFRLPSHLFDSGETVLIWQPASDTTKIVSAADSIALTVLFEGTGPQAAVALLLDEVFYGVLHALDVKD